MGNYRTRRNYNKLSISPDRNTVRLNRLLKIGLLDLSCGEIYVC